LGKQSGDVGVWLGKLGSSCAGRSNWVGGRQEGKLEHQTWPVAIKTLIKTSRLEQIYSAVAWFSINDVVVCRMS